MLLHKLCFGVWVTFEDFGGIGQNVKGFVDW